jgi:hypothetical protein
MTIATSVHNVLLLARVRPSSSFLRPYASQARAGAAMSSRSLFGVRIDTLPSGKLSCAKRMLFPEG